MFSSFYKTLSGLNAFREELSVISNNIANSETTAYKSEGTSFAEVLDSSSTSKSTSVSVGNGVSVLALTTDWIQGTTVDTSSTTDLAITGSGFFTVVGTDGLTYYTRDGEFDFNDNKTLVTADDATVQGYTLDANGVRGAVGDITIPKTIAATATKEMTTTLNLNSATATAGTFSSTVNVYDSLGNKIAVTIEFTKTASNEWDWTASIPSGTGTATGSGTLTFDSDGNLAAGTDPTISLALTNGATTPQAITWDLYALGATNGKLTQNASDSVLSDKSQDGTAPGKLESASIDSTGVVTATYSNGATKELFQIALAAFSNNDGLSKVGNSLYAETLSSGKATVGVAGSDQFGTLSSGKLEESNVDLASEMAKMIIAQRAYESCAKMFTTESEIMQTTINMLK